ncbi:MAG: LysM domain-containing protein [Ilumatobacteraceae bacterium]
MRRLIVLPLVTLALPVLAAACGSDDSAFTSLPPIEVTTTTTTTTTTVSTDRIFYTIKPGESLAIIAESFEVPVAAIVDVNDIDDPDNVQAGQTIEIPSGVQLVTELPTTTTTEN